MAPLSIRPSAGEDPNRGLASPNSPVIIDPRKPASRPIRL